MSPPGPALPIRNVCSPECLLKSRCRVRSRRPCHNREAAFMTQISRRASPIIEFASSPPVFRGHDMLLSQHRQLTPSRIHLDFAAADDRGGYVLVKTDKHGKISKRGT